MSSEVIHWGSAQLIWTGEHYQLEMSAALDQSPANWLHLNLAQALSPVFGSGVEVAVTPAQRSAHGFESFGVIAIHPVKRPFPNAGAVHKALTDAVDQAYAEAAVAERDANNWLPQLRTG